MLTKRSIPMLSASPRYIRKSNFDSLLCPIIHLEISLKQLPIHMIQPDRALDDILLLVSLNHPKL